MWLPLYVLWYNITLWYNLVFSFVSYTFNYITKEREIQNCVKGKI